ncbi:MAG TPA: hypothetical protein VLH56_16990 [Dissulfurispiraceae bacterium]|nr:hypothetical protein [Dissulfurispiraceae bacterium]
MPLNKLQLKNDIKAAFNAVKDQEDNQAQAIDTLAGRIADAIDSYVRQANITATPAHVVAAALSNAGGPVVAANNLTSTIN